MPTPLILPPAGGNFVGDLGAVGAFQQPMTIADPKNHKPRLPLAAGDNIIEIPVFPGALIPVNLILIQPPLNNTTVDWALNGINMDRQATAKIPVSTQNPNASILLTLSAPAIFEFEMN